MGGFELLVTTVVALFAVASCRPAICEEPPPWKVEGRDPMGQHRGNVTIVSLLQASCSLCIWQAIRLDDLLVKLNESGINDIRTVIINSNDIRSRMFFGKLKLAAGKIPVYEDNIVDNVWKTLEGGKDDFFIYDRCGRLAFYVPYPHSLLYKPYTLAAIMATYYDNPCGPCLLKPTPEISKELNCMTDEHLLHPNCSLSNVSGKAIPDTSNNSSANIDANIADETIPVVVSYNATDPLRFETAEAERNISINGTSGLVLTTPSSNMHATMHPTQPQINRSPSEPMSNVSEKNQSSINVMYFPDDANRSLVAIKPQEPFIFLGHHHKHVPRRHRHRLPHSIIRNPKSNILVPIPEVEFESDNVTTENPHSRLLNESLESQNVQHPNNSGSALNITDEYDEPQNSSLETTLSINVTDTFPEVANATINTIEFTSLAPKTVRDIYDKHHDYLAALTEALGDWLSLKKVPPRTTNIENGSSTPATTTAVPTMTKKILTTTKSPRRKKPRNRDRLKQSRSQLGCSEFNLTDCQEWSWKRQLKQVKECCRIDPYTRSNKVEMRLKCEKITEDKCKKFLRKSTCCQIEEDLKEMDGSSSSTEESEKIVDDDITNGTCCLGFDSDFCSHLEFHGIYNLSCCNTGTLPPILPETDVLCQDVSRHTKVPRVLVGPLGSVVQSEKSEMKGLCQKNCSPNVEYSAECRLSSSREITRLPSAGAACSCKDADQSPACQKGQSPACQKGQSPACQKGQSPACQKGQSPARQEGQSPARQEGQSPARQEGQSPARQEGQSPARKEGQSPAREEGQSPACKEGQSPACKEGQSPACQEGQSPACKEGQSPACQEGQSPACKEGQSPACKEGQSPACKEGQSPACQEGQSPACQEAQSPACQEAQSPACQEAQSPACQEGQSPACQEGQSPACQEGQSPACQEGQSPACQEGQSPACKEGQSPACKGGQSPACQEAQSPACQEGQSPACQKGQSPNAIGATPCKDKDDKKCSSQGSAIGDCSSDSPESECSGQITPGKECLGQTCPGKEGPGQACSGKECSGKEGPGQGCSDLPTCQQLHSKNSIDKEMLCKDMGCSRDSDSKGCVCVCALSASACRPLCHPPSQ